MNNIYKVIWSKAKNCYVVASEIARSHTKSATGSEKIGGVTRRSLLASLMALSLLCGGLGVASAADSTVHVDASTTPGNATEVYTTTGVNTLLADYGKKSDVENNKNSITTMNTTITTQGQSIATNVANIANNTKAIEKKIDTEAADLKYATKEALADKADQTTVTALDVRVGDVEGKVTTLETKVGDATGGLVKDVADLKAQGITLNTELGNKVNQTDLVAATTRITANEGNITNLQKKTANLTDDGKALTGMTTVSGTTVSGTNVEANALKVTGQISDGTVNTTLAKIDASMTQTAANKDAIDTLQTTTNGQADAIKDLKDRTTNISYDSGKRSTSINGIDIGDTQVDMNGKNLTDVGTINGIDLGTKQKGNYISQDGSIWGNMLEVDDQVKTNADAIAKETADRKAAIGELAVDGKYIKKGMNVSDNLVELDKQAKTNADNIQTNANNIKTNKDEIARVNGELVKTNDYFNKELGKTNDYFNKELGKTNNHFNTELGKTNAALQEEGKVRANADAALASDITATNKRTAGIGRTDTGVEADNQTVIEDTVHFDQNGNVSGVKDLQTNTIHATGGITSEGLDAGSGEITTKGKVSAGDISTGTLETTGNAKIGGDLTVNGKLNVDEISMKNDRLDPNGDQHHSATTITADGISNDAKVTDKNGVTTESKFTHDKEGSTTYAYQGDAANWKKSTSNVTADGVENVAEDSKGNNNTFTQTSTDTKNILKDKEGNTSSTRQDSKGIYGFAKDKDGNKSYTKQEGNRIAESVIGQDGKETKSEMTSTDITNTAKDGTITNTAKKVTNEGTESVTNKVGNNEVKVSQNGVDIKAEAGKKITESVGTASRVVENDKITDEAGDSTVTTEKGKGTTFGKEGGTTNIYGDSIKTGTINAKDTTTDKLTAGAAAGANGGRLTVDADGVKGSYKSDKYTSKSYILANTLKSGVDNGKEPIDADFVGSRTDHYMDGDKAKLDETVKDADGSNVTKKTSTDTATTITDGITTTKTEQGTKDITNTATAGTITNDAKVITNKASEVINNEAININNTATGTITSKASEIKNEADKLISNKVGENTWENMEDGKITTSIKNGTKQNLTQSDAEKTEHSVVNGSNSTVNKQTSEEITDAVTNGTTTNVTQNTATSSNNTIADTNGNANTVVSTVDGTKFTNTGANTAIREGTVTDTTIKGNTITTGKVTMDYADVMKDLGVHGNATVDKDMTVKGNTTLGEAGKDTTLTVNSKATFKEIATFENGAEVKNGLTVSSGGLNVTGESMFNDKVTMNNGLDVTGGVASDSFTVKGTDIKIDSSGINAGGTVISNVADGSISEGSKDAVNGGQLYQVKNDLEGKVNKVGANAAAMANLHPMEFDPDSKWNIAAAMGNYGSETATAIGAFYRPNEDVMVNFSTAFGTGENMVGGGVSVRLGKGSNKLSREESNALKDQVNDLTARMDALLSVLNPNMSKDFPDVPENHWAYEAVSRLAGNDIVQGYPDGEFHGERTMTRYEMAEIIYNALSRGAEAEKELVEEFKPELQAMAASEKATAERAEG